jgi:predicted nucleotidyltransferase
MPVEGRPPWVPSREDIERVAREIAEKFDPEKIILFGSYAYGTPTGDSDVDMLVLIETDERPPKVAARLRTAIRPSFAWDVLVRHPAEVKRRVGLGDWFLKTVTEQGEVLYERADTGVADQGRE